MDVEEVRNRIRGMTDEQLLSYGKAAAYMCTPKAKLGHLPREAFPIWVREARADFGSETLFDPAVAVEKLLCSSEWCPVNFQ